MIKEEKEKLVRQMLIAIGENPERPGIKGTPERIVRMWDEIFRGYDETKKPKVTTFMNGEDGVDVDSMIHDKGTFHSHCEHHWIPFFGNYYFAYIPNPKGKILGLSKVGRVVDFYAAKLQIQERLVSDVVKEIEAALTFEKINKDGSKEIIKPLGIALTIEAEHLCKTMRGVKKKGQMRSTKLTGVLKDDIKSRQEFLNWVNKNDR